MRVMRTLLFLMLSSAALADSDPRAVTVGKAMWSALGGDAGWNRARYFRFDFVVDRQGKHGAPRQHYWDRFSGRYRVDGTDKAGARFSVYFNTSTRPGEVVLDGKKVEDAAG